MLNHKSIWFSLPLVLLALIPLTGLRSMPGRMKHGQPAVVPAPKVPAMRVGTAGKVKDYPHNLPLLTLDGQAVNLSDLKGKAVFVNLWASWCPPCRAEMPGIEALYKKMDPSKVAFVMLSLDENVAKAQKFMKAKGYTFPVYLRTSELPAPFDSNSIPSTIILGPDGQVAARHDGMANYNTPEFKAGLEQLAATTGR